MKNSELISNSLQFVSDDYSEKIKVNKLERFLKHVYILNDFTIDAVDIVIDEIKRVNSDVTSW